MEEREKIVDSYRVILSLEKSFHSISLKESKADHLVKSKPPGHLDLLKLTNDHLVRIYPGAKRQDSSNINPVPYWTYGKRFISSPTTSIFS